MDNDITNITVTLTDEQADGVLAAVCRAAAVLAADPANVDTIRSLAVAMADIDGDTYPGCDACTIGRYSQLVVEAADALIPPPSHVYNPWDGTPEVTICGFCALAEDDRPFDDDPDPAYAAAEMERMVREEQALTEGDWS